MNNRKTFQRIFWTIDWRHNIEPHGIQHGDTQYNSTEYSEWYCRKMDCQIISKSCDKNVHLE